MNKGKNDLIAFLPPNTKIGVSIKYVKDKENICLTTDQTTYSYKRVEQQGVVNVDGIKQKTEGDRLNRNDIDNEREINPHYNIKYK